MEITDVRMKLSNREGDRLKAFCTITFDGQFVVRDVRLVEGTSGLFVAMPSRKISTGCPKCGGKNPVLSKFCNNCGERMPESVPEADTSGAARIHRDVAHPITPEFRERLQAAVIRAYEQRLEQAESDEDIVEEAEDEFSNDDNIGNRATRSEYDEMIAGMRRRAGIHVPRSGNGGNQRHRGASPQPTRQEGRRQDHPPAPRRDQGRPAPRETERRDAAGPVRGRRHDESPPRDAGLTDARENRDTQQWDVPEEPAGNRWAFEEMPEDDHVDSDAPPAPKPPRTEPDEPAFGEGIL